MKIDSVKSTYIGLQFSFNPVINVLGFVTSSDLYIQESSFIWGLRKKIETNWVVFLRQKKAYLPVGELNPGLPRDRRGYLPLY